MSLERLIKYPRTEHLVNTGGTATTEDDLVVGDVAGACKILSSDPSRPVIVEEKVDGANLGISIINNEIRVQNRSHWISTGEHAQFSMIQPWIEEHREALMEILESERLILYGEWCAAKHSIPYSKLPGSYFLAFDLFDVEADRFYSRPRFHYALQGTGIPVVPTIGILPPLPSRTSSGVSHTITSKNRNNKSPPIYDPRKKDSQDLLETVLQLLETKSRFRGDQGTVEGIVLRRDNGPWMEQKYKIVRPDFVRGCQAGHWTRRAIDKQTVDYYFGEKYLKECFVFANEWQEDPDEQHMRNDVPVTNNVDLDKMLQARRRRVPRCIVLMGLPASGKSTFAKTLANALNAANGSAATAATAASKTTTIPTIVANQDELGRKQCLQMASRANPQSCRMIVDRCHLTVAERREVYECLHSPTPRDIALIHFAAPAETCLQRAQLRIGHPTVGPGKGRPESVVAQMEQRLELPTEQERQHLFGRIVTIHTWQGAKNLLLEWGVVSR